MIDTPRILKTAAQRTAVVHLTIAKPDIRHAMGPGREELFAALKAQGVDAAGPWFTRHFRMFAEGWDFEIGVPVNAPITPEGRVANGELPAATVARTIYRGGFEGLSAAWPQLDAWVAAQGRKGSPSLWETYAKGPETGADASKWETELTRPLAD